MVVSLQKQFKSFWLKIQEDRGHPLFCKGNSGLRRNAQVHRERRYASSDSLPAHLCTNIRIKMVAKIGFCRSQTRFVARRSIHGRHLFNIEWRTLGHGIGCDGNLMQIKFWWPNYFCTLNYGFFLLSPLFIEINNLNAHFSNLRSSSCKLQVGIF